MSRTLPFQRNHFPVLLALLAPLCLRAANWYVSPTGNDAFTGSETSPFKTIDRGIEAAAPGDTVVVREGVYREVIQPTTSAGASGNPITVRPYSENGVYEQVQVRGLKVITPGSGGLGTWQLHDAANHVYKIQLSAAWDLFVQNASQRSNQLFLDGEILIEARWPNLAGYAGLREADLALGTGSYSGTSDPYNGTYAAAGLDAFADNALAGTTIVFNPGQRWFTLEGSVSGNSAAAGEVYFSFNKHPFTLGYHFPDAGDRFHLKGSLLLLDAPGEWFFDATGAHGPAYTLYVRLPDDGDPASRTLEMRAQDRTLDLYSTSWITFERMEFFAAFASSGTGNNGMTFEQITFIHCGNGGGRHGLVLQGTDNTVRGCVSLMNPGSAIRMVAGSGNVVEDTLILDAGYLGYDGNALTVEGAVRVAGNTVLNTGAHGITVKGAGALVEGNRVGWFGALVQDVAGINLFGGGNQGGAEWRHNVVHDGLAPYLDYPGHNGSLGIRLDNGGATTAGYNLVIHHNLVRNITNSGLNVWGVRDAQLESGDTQADVDIRVYNNTCDADMKLVGSNSDFRFTGVTLRNNIVTGTLIGTVAQALAEAIIQDNLLAANTIAGNITGNAAFTAVAAFDYTLAPGSLGIDAGAILIPFTDGFSGSAPDIGAFESGTAAWFDPDADYVSPQTVAWRLAHFGAWRNTGDAADTADPDLDGIINLVERALGLDPWTSSTTGLPTLAFDPLSQTFSLQFTQSPAASDLACTVESCDDLATWTDAPPAGNRQFLRLRVAPTFQ
ncbi:MAG: right-handed parallel beta-helix repeat-containing protein [Oceanipulchritudo sp.]